MSTLRVSTIQDTAGSNSSTPAAIANGIAKAWVNFNGTGVVAIRAQYNVSSITDNGVGNYRVNFTTAMSDANYSAVASANIAATFNQNTHLGSMTTGFVELVQAGADYYDVSQICVSIFR